MCVSAKLELECDLQRVAYTEKKGTEKNCTVGYFDTVKYDSDQGGISQKPLSRTIHTKSQASDAKHTQTPTTSTKEKTTSNRTQIKAIYLRCLIPVRCVFTFG